MACGNLNCATHCEFRRCAIVEITKYGYIATFEPPIIMQRLSVNSPLGDSNLGIGLNFLERKSFNFGYQLVSESKGLTHELRVSYGSSRYKKESKRWDTY